MRANDSTAEADKSTDVSTTRRRLLGGAAALATIPTTASAASEEDDNDPDDTEPTGPRRTETGRLTGVWSTTELGEERDEDAEISTVGYSRDDEPGRVEVWVSTNPARTCLNLDVEQTREWARRLLEAADAAEGGE